jgi:ABC-type transport system involved in cytochrome bd biosynthesis fused ATPase/permease subunit
MTDTPEFPSLTNTPWSDDPIDSETQDILDRGRFVTMVAERIDACLLGQESTVFGLLGPWGSGKSSLINLILNELDEVAARRRVVDYSRRWHWFATPLNGSQCP